MAKILFINPVIREADAARHVPYGMALNAAVLIKEGHLVQLFDANGWRASESEIIEAITADAWDVIATGGITTAYRSIKKIVPLCKKYSPDSLVIIGGGVLTSMPHDIMKFLPEVDVGIVGEALKSLPEVIKKIDSAADKKNISWENVKGIIWRNKSGKVILNQPESLLMDLDSLPYPAWELFPLEEVYFPNSSILLSEESMAAKKRLNINTSYGCSFACKFCFHLGLVGELSVAGDDSDRVIDFTKNRVVRYHSPGYIVDMVKYAKQRFNIDFIIFLDENLMTTNVHTKGKWLSEICELWVKEGLQPDCIKKGVHHTPEKCNGIHWGGTGHAALYTPDLLKKMRNAGCSYIDYGFETFSARLLKTLGKGSTPELNAKSLKDTMRAGIRPIPNQIIGFPDEFFDSILDSMHYWGELGVQARPFYATPYPGCEWYYTFKKEILEQFDNDLEKFLLSLDEATDFTVLISKNFSAVELIGLRELMIKRDYKRIIEYAKEWKKLHGEPKFNDELSKEMYEKSKNKYEYEK